MANLIKDGAINGTHDNVSVSIEYDGLTAGAAYVFTNAVPAGCVITGITLNTSTGAVLGGTGTLRVAVGGPVAWVTGVIAVANCVPGPLSLTAGSPLLVQSGPIHITAGGTVNVVGKHTITISYIAGI